MLEGILELLSNKKPEYSTIFMSIKTSLKHKNIIWCISTDDSNLAISICYILIKHGTGEDLHIVIVLIY